MKATIQGDAPVLRRRAARRYSFRSQFNGLFRKSATLRKRDWKQNICQCSFPIFILLVVLGLQALVNSLVSDENPERPNGFLDPPFFLLKSPLRPGTRATFAYYAVNGSAGVHGGPGSTGLLGNITQPTIEVKVLSQDEESAGLTTITNKNLDLINATPANYTFASYATRQAMEDNLRESWFAPASLVGGYGFEELDFRARRFRIQAFQNYTLTNNLQDMPFIIGLVVDTLSSMIGVNSTSRLAGIKSFPNKGEELTFDLATLAGPFFYFLILLQTFPLTLTAIVHEKQYKLRSIMLMSGMKMRVYWLSHYIFGYLLYLVVTFMLYLGGILLNFRFFRVTSPVVIWLIFLLWGHVLVSIAMLMSVFFTRTRTATLVGYFSIIVIGFVGTNMVTPIIQDVDNTPAGTAFGLSMFPPFALYRSLIYMSIEASFNGAGYQISELSQPGMNMGQIYGILFFQWIIILLLALYLDQVLPSEFGIAKHPLWCFKRSRTTFDEDGRPVFNRKSSLLEQPFDDDAVGLLSMGLEGDPPDVVAEAKRVTVAADDRNPAVRVHQLRKVWPAKGGDKKVIALQGLTMGIDQNQCIGILGHNGAGKTTFLSCLSGLVKPSSGTATVYGQDIVRDTEQIHSNLGICPQHDVLWKELTAEEHMLFIGRLKNMDKTELPGMVQRALEEVSLWDVRSRKVRGFSGGMKRRLSVAIALLGDPQLIMLDEPTTGLDPASKRRVWDAIRAHKTRSSIILTSHSVEEADALCDRIAVFAGGRMKCIGRSTELKGRFGQFYKLTVQCSQNHVEAATDFVMSMYPNAHCVHQVGGTRTYEVPKEDLEFGELFEQMTENKDRLSIVDWGVTNTTLEEVFLRVTGDAQKLAEAGREAPTSSVFGTFKEADD